MKLIAAPQDVDLARGWYASRVSFLPSALLASFHAA
jgi:hypothetical protein